VEGNMMIVEGRAPANLVDLPPANKVFIGGSDGDLAALIQTSWQQLPVGGLLVASAVMEHSKAQLIQFAQTLPQPQKETLQIAVSKGTTLAGQLLYKPGLTVTLFKFIKR
jgi:precorrin-6Y C5,15-methyltransferase (decarboxylating)